MTKTLCVAAVAVLLVVSGCGDTPENVDAGPATPAAQERHDGEHDDHGDGGSGKSGQKGDQKGSTENPPPPERRQLTVSIDGVVQATIDLVAGIQVVTASRFQGEIDLTGQTGEGIPAGCVDFINNTNDELMVDVTGAPQLHVGVSNTARICI